MANVVEVVNLVKSDPKVNNNKYWRGTLMDDGMVHCEWGRIGAKNPQRKVQPGGKSFLDKKVKSKMRDGRNGEIGYRKSDIVSGNVSSQTTVKSVKSGSLSSIAKKQIKTAGDSETGKLIDFLTVQNVHNITQASGGQITYNYDSGLFQTPLGLVSQASIDEARIKLGLIYDLIDDGDYGNEMMELTRDFLMMVPQDIGRKRLELPVFWKNTGVVSKQNSILDGLQTSLVTATSSPTKKKADSTPEEQVFDTGLELISNKKLLDVVFRNYNWGRSHQHSCFHYQPTRLWRVHIRPMRKAFEGYGKSLSNQIEGYHGTGAENLLSLLKTGFFVAPPKKAKIAGKMFGSGTYTAPCHIKGSSTKAANYSLGYWTGGSTKRTFMFICDVGMGKSYMPPTSCNGVPKGYDSCWAKAGKTKSWGGYLLNDETIVYREDQIDIKYLLEITT